MRMLKEKVSVEYMKPWLKAFCFMAWFRWFTMKNHIEGATLEVQPRSWDWDNYADVVCLPGGDDGRNLGSIWVGEHTFNLLSLRELKALVVHELGHWVNKSDPLSEVSADIFACEHGYGKALADALTTILNEEDQRWQEDDWWDWDYCSTYNVRVASLVA